MKLKDKINLFKCPVKSCRHGGKLSAWPKVIAIEEFKIDEDFKISASDLELYEESLNCFHTKKSWKSNQIGLGLRVTRISRTGGIN